MLNPVRNNSGTNVKTTCAKLLGEVQEKKTRMQYLYDRYYSDKEQTLFGQPVNDTEVKVNHEYLIATLKTGYFLGKPVQFDHIDKEGLKFLTDYYLSNELQITDSDIGLYSSICGVWYELLYLDGNNIKSVAINGFKTVMIVSDDVKPQPLLAIIERSKYNPLEKGNGQTQIVYDIYDDKYKYTVDYSQDTTITKIEHKMSTLPVIQYLNNDEAKGSFENVLSLMDSLNSLLGNSIKDKQAFVDAILVGYGVDIEGMNLTSGQDSPATVTGLPTDSKLEWLTKTLTESDVIVLREELTNYIYNIAMIPNIFTITNSGASSLSLKQNFTPLEMQLTVTEKQFRRSLNIKLKIIIDYLISIMELRESFREENLTITFVRNLPVNYIELAQTLQTFVNSQLISRETAMAQIGIIQNVGTELERIKDEQKLLDELEYGFASNDDNDIEDIEPATNFSDIDGTILQQDPARVQ